MSQAQLLFATVARGSLIKQILLALVAAVMLAVSLPELARSFGLLGDLFVRGLKAVAPLLVFVLVTAAICRQKTDAGPSIRPVLMLYLAGTLLAALVAVVMSMLFPVTLTLVSANVAVAPPEGIDQVLRNLIFKLVDNPVTALSTGNFIGILAWAVGLGLALRQASPTSRQLVGDLSDAVSAIVKVIIRLAPLGIFGLVANTVAQTGVEALLGYAELLSVLLASMLLVALVINPVLVFARTGRNPYPLVFTCLRESGVTAFFTRSSAANIPVNMALCHKLGLNRELYAVSIPLGATINMAGAAITITVLSLAAVNTLGIEVDLATALLLSAVSAVSACGASGVAGGSLLLIPLACSLFGVSNEVAMEVVAVGFIIGVVQDSAETGLNSSTDVLFTAAAQSSR